MVWARHAALAFALATGATSAAGCADAGSPGRCADAPVPPAAATGAWAIELAPVGDESVLAPSGATMTPLVAWDGRAWNVAWDGTWLSRSEDGASLARAAAREPTGMDVGTCVRAIAARGEMLGESTIAWLDGRGSSLGTIAVAGAQADVARGADAWWIASSDGASIAVRASEPGGRAVREIDRVVAGPAAAPRVVATPAGTTIAWADSAGVSVRTVARGDDRAPSTVRAMAANVWSFGALELVALGDHVVIAASDGALVHAAIYDAASAAMIAGPIAVARTTSRARPSLAAIPERDVAVLCHAGSTEAADRISIAVLGRDAAPAASVTLDAGGPARGAACAWNGRELLVVWSRDDAVLARRVDVGQSIVF